MYNPNYRAPHCCLFAPFARLNDSISSRLRFVPLALTSITAGLLTTAVVIKGKGLLSSSIGMD